MKKYPEDSITPEEIIIRRRVNKAVRLSLRRNWKQIVRMQRKEERQRQRKSEGNGN